MKTIILFCCLLGSLGGLWGAERSPLSAIGEDAWMALSVRSLSEMRATLEDHPLSEIFGNEALQAFFAASKEDGEAPSFKEVLEDEFHLSYDELFELFPGEAHLVVFGFGEVLGEAGERPEIAVLAEFSGDEARMDELMTIQFERNAKAQREVNPAMEHRMIEEVFMGETLYFDEAFDGETTYIEDGYALVDGVFLLATPESRLRGLVEALKEGQDGPLSGSEAYLRMTGEGVTPDVSFFVNLAVIAPALDTALARLARTPQMAAAGVTQETLARALALEVLQGAYFSGTLKPDGLLMHSGLVYTEKRGLMSLLAYGEGPLPSGEFVPDAPVSTSVSLFDFGLMFENLEKLLAAASPSLGQMLEMQIQMLETNLGINLRAAILQNLGEETVGFAQFDSATTESGGSKQPRQVVAFSLDDAELFRGALNAILDMNPQLRAMLQTEDYEGYQILTIPGQPNPVDPGTRMDDVSYAVTRSHLFLSIGRVAVLKECLSRLDNPGGGFWSEAATEELFSGISRSNAVGRTYTEVGQLADSVLGAIARARVVGGHNTADLSTELDLPFVLATEINEEPDGIFGRSLLRTKDVEDAK